MDSKMADFRMPPLNRQNHIEKELREIYMYESKDSKSLSKATCCSVFFLENPEKMRKLKDRQAKWLSKKAKLQSLKEIKEYDSDVIFVSISCPDINILSCYLAVKDDCTILTLFHHFLSKYFKRMKGYLRFEDYRIEYEEVLIWKDTPAGKLPLTFEYIPAPIDMPVKLLVDKTIVMTKKEYKDEIQENSEIFSQNQSKLQLIKSFDLSYGENMRTMDQKDLNKYDSGSIAKYYEVRRRLT